jgi:hypothetical protein
MSVNTAAIQKLYVAYFNRPADFSGLNFWENAMATAKDPNAMLATISAQFAASDEYKATFAGLDTQHVVERIYLNLFGRTPDLVGLNFWTQALLNKNMTIDNAVTKIAEGAQGSDIVIINNKVAAATAFSAALDTTPEALNYAGDRANTAAKAWLSTVTDTASLSAAIDKAALDATVANVTKPYYAPINTTLSAGVDTFNGGLGDDVVYATTADGKNALTTFDSIDGGAGNDTIRFVDTQTAAGAAFVPALNNATVQNIENVNVVTTGGINLNTRGWTGVTDVTVTAAGTGSASILAANSTNVTLAAAAAAGAATAIAGGKAVNVALTDAGAGTVNVMGAGLTNVTIKGGNGINIDNVGTDAAATTAKGATLTTVALEGIAGNATVGGAALANLSLKNIATTNNVVVNNGTAGHTLNLSLDTVGKTGAAATVVTVVDAAAKTVSIAANGASNVALAAGAATNVNLLGSKSMTLNLTGDTKLVTIDGSAASGDLVLTGIAGSANAIATGSGADTFTVTTATVKDDVSTTADETVNATIASGAGNDIVTLATTGNGKVTLATGAGNDTVNIASRGTETLNISLGDGNDTLTAAVAITANDLVDAGAGTDTLALKLVGSANIGAFSGFDLFDTAGLGKALDVDILTTKNTVSEIIASGDVGPGAALINVGAGVGVRVTGDIGASNLSITQKAPGALTVTVDADETGTANDAADFRGAAITAENATSLKAVFDTSYLASTTAEKALGAWADNVTSLNLTGKNAASLEIVSGGALSNNFMTYNDSGKLGSVSVSGTQALDLAVNGGTVLRSVDASASTGGLTFGTDDLADGGTVILGSGVDHIWVGANSVASGMESVQGFEKTLAVALSTTAADSVASKAAWADADTLVMTGARVADGTHAGLTLGSLSSNGVLTFNGAGPSTLSDAMTIADSAAESANESLLFQYLGDSYVFVQNGATDVIVKLVGITGVTAFAENGTTDNFTVV